MRDSDMNEYGETFKNNNLKESVTIPLSKNDMVLFGKWKNKKAVVKGFSKDDKGQPILKTDKKDLPLLGVRLTKESSKLLSYKRLS